MPTPKDEEVWRLPNTAKGKDTKLLGGSGAHRSPSLSPAAKERMARIVGRTPEVMVKVTGRTRGITHLKAHFDYLTRNGRIVAETQAGELIGDRTSLRELHDEWLLSNAAEARGRNTPQGAQSVGIILSMPPGAPRDRVEDAARTWARETFAEKHDWIMVRHDDRDHPHVHVSVRAVGTDGRRLSPGPADLQSWRDRFARELRRLGVAAEATPRQARGKVRRAEKLNIYHVEKRGVPSTARAAEQSDVLRSTGIQTPLAQPRAWDRDIQARQEAVRRAYLVHAAGLATGDARDRRLAADIQRFVEDMPVPLTRRQALTVELRKVLETQNQTASQLPARPQTVERDQGELQQRLEPTPPKQTPPRIR